MLPVCAAVPKQPQVFECFRCLASAVPFDRLTSPAGGIQKGLKKGSLGLHAGGIGSIENTRAIALNEIIWSFTTSPPSVPSEIQPRIIYKMLPVCAAVPKQPQVISFKAIAVG
jgi:hypothetical protein